MAAPLVANSQLAVPELWGTRVHDDAKVLRHETADLLERELAAHEDSTGNQIAILIINSLEGEAIEEYALKVAEKWKLGSEKNDNGALLVVSINDHKIRIEVGQGLEGVLTDAMCSRIIRNEIAPAFRRNDYDAGMIEGTHAIVNAIKGEYKAEEAESDSLGVTDRLIFGLFIFIALGSFTWAAIIVEGGVGWGLYFFLIIFYLAFTWIPLGWTGGVAVTIAYILITPIVRVLLWRSPAMRTKMKKWRENSRAAGGKTWTSGGGFSSRGFGSGRSGGFSGGGGSFRGGGASGGW